MAVFISMVAIIAAIQGFSYMYQRKKLDMYMSVPVTKGRRFAAIYLNGFLVYFLSYLLNLLLSFFVGQAMGASTSLAVEEAPGHCWEIPFCTWQYTMLPFWRLCSPGT